MIVTITAGELATSVAFYDAALGALGWVRVDELVDEEEDAAELEAIGWGRPEEAATIWVVAGAEPTSGLHLRLTTRARLDVETFFSDALDAGGAEYAAPRRWTPYRRGEFTATVRDPDGNLLEAVAPE